jgi:hypothetical protein
MNLLDNHNAMLFKAAEYVWRQSVYIQALQAEGLFVPLHLDHLQGTAKI